jgi:predicted DNA binding CopG/RHH family protein
MKTIPVFNNQKEEINFWDKNDATEYFDMTKAKRVKFPNLKKSTKTISLRLPEDMLEKIKVQANALDVPYQSFIKMLLQKELHQIS